MFTRHKGAPGAGPGLSAHRPGARPCVGAPPSEALSTACHPVPLPSGRSWMAKLQKELWQALHPELPITSHRHQVRVLPLLIGPRPADTICHMLTPKSSSVHMTPRPLSFHPEAQRTPLVSDPLVWPWCPGSIPPHFQAPPSHPGPCLCDISAQLFSENNRLALTLSLPLPHPAPRQVRPS